MYEHLTVLTVQNVCALFCTPKWIQLVRSYHLIQYLVRPIVPTLSVRFEESSYCCTCLYLRRSPSSLVVQPNLWVKFQVSAWSLPCRCIGTKVQTVEKADNRVFRGAQGAIGTVNRRAVSRARRRRADLTRLSFRALWTPDESQPLIDPRRR